MQVFQDAFHNSDLPFGAIGTIGNFDGVHRGQQEIVRRVVERARQEELPALVITFEPHPLEVLRPAEAPPRISTLEQKIGLLEELGIDAVLVIRFDQEFARQTAEDFAEGFLHGRLGLREIHVGAGFVFGRDRQGNVPLLKRLGEQWGFLAFGIEEVAAGGRRVSSTRIRQAILEGRVEDAQDMLGRPPQVAGIIVRGDRMGKRLGWPTINVAADSELLPADGVYACQVFFPKIPATFDCATNIGTRPTVYENYQRVVEAHILDFSTDVYGERVEISFFKRLREERIFPSVMDLSAQIRLDVEATREFFAARRGLADNIEGSIES
jgi:riboflavin kinase/FMN adenylyltransferase